MYPTFRMFASLALVSTFAAAGCGGGGGAKPATPSDPGGGGGASAAPTVTVQQIDWLNRTYDPGVVPPVTLVDGGVVFTTEEEERAAFDLFEPPYFEDLTGDGADEAILFTILDVPSLGRQSTVDVWTIRDGKEVLLARLPSGDDDHISEVNPVDGVLRLERQVTVDDQRKLRYEEWTWNGTALVEDVAKRTFEDDGE